MKKVIVSLLLVVSLLMVSMSVFAGNYTAPTVTHNYGSNKWEQRFSFSYNTNNTSSIELTQLNTWVKNTGSWGNISYLEYHVFDQGYTKNTIFSDPNFTEVAPGNSRSFSANWQQACWYVHGHNSNSTYPKNSTVILENTTGIGYIYGGVSVIAHSNYFQNDSSRAAQNGLYFSMDSLTSDYIMIGEPVFYQDENGDNSLDFSVAEETGEGQVVYFVEAESSSPVYVKLPDAFVSEAIETILEPLTIDGESVIDFNGKEWLSLHSVKTEGDEGKELLVLRFDAQENGFVPRLPELQFEDSVIPALYTSIDYNENMEMVGGEFAFFLPDGYSNQSIALTIDSVFERVTDNPIVEAQ